MFVSFFGWRGFLKLEAVNFHGLQLSRVGRLEIKLLILRVDRGGDSCVLLLRAEVALDYVEGFLVDVQILMGLQEFDFV